jgi:hypothetical protein
MHIFPFLFLAVRVLQAEAAYSSALSLLSADSIGGTEAAVLHSNRAGARLMVGGLVCVCVCVSICVCVSLCVYMCMCIYVCMCV